jgi:hypothetical protein
VYASSVKNTIPTSRGFDFYTYANQDPNEVPGNEPDADKFNARALRSFEALMNRAERLEKLVRIAPAADSPVKRVSQLRLFASGMSMLSCPQFPLHSIGWLCGHRWRR